MNQRRSALGWLTAALWMMACGGEPAQTGGSRARFATAAGSQPTLEVIPVRDTVGRGEPVRVAYLLYNPGDEREMRYGERMVGFTVTSPDGKPLPQHTNPALMEGEFPPARTKLPRNGLVGGVVDLTCGAPVHPEAAGEARACGWRYDFSTPGRYRLVAHYYTLSRPDVANPRAGVNFLDLKSDTAVVVVK
ncbi:MAG TPA: hypothetical protein VF665_02315 [Longimicrobium sp.]|jgi:hypothetical protein|uniref:hypothetical protein n=1 Tax=Longimicrobium sp. TaxID=2029185 RepID=UPI002EDA0304